MTTPVTVSFKELPESDAVVELVHRRADELQKYCDHVTSCRVVVARPHRHGRNGARFAVNVEVRVPGEELVVNREHHSGHAHEDPCIAVRDAFDAMRRQVQAYTQCRRGEVKRHDSLAPGRITMLHPHDGYGFICTNDAREVYFHRNALATGDFDALRIGDRVVFIEENGEQGPQARGVRLYHRPVHHLRGATA